MFCYHVDICMSVRMSVVLMSLCVSLFVFLCFWGYDDVFVALFLPFFCQFFLVWFEDNNVLLSCGYLYVC